MGGRCIAQMQPTAAVVEGLVKVAAADGSVDRIFAGGTGRGRRHRQRRAPDDDPAAGKVPGDAGVPRPPHSVEGAGVEDVAGVLRIHGQALPRLAPQFLPVLSAVGALVHSERAVQVEDPAVEGIEDQLVEGEAGKNGRPSATSRRCCGTGCRGGGPKEAYIVCGLEGWHCTRRCWAVPAPGRGPRVAAVGGPQDAGTGRAQQENVGGAGGHADGFDFDAGWHGLLTPARPAVGAFVHLAGRGQVDNPRGLRVQAEVPARTGDRLDHGPALTTVGAAEDPGVAGGEDEEVVFGMDGAGLDGDVRRDRYSGPVETPIPAQVEAIRGADPGKQRVGCLRVHRHEADFPSVRAAAGGMVHPAVRGPAQHEAQEKTTSRANLDLDDMVDTMTMFMGFPRLRVEQECNAARLAWFCRYCNSSRRIVSIVVAVLWGGN